MLAALFADEPGGVSLAELRARGWIKLDLGQAAAPHAEGGFGTADGKLAFRTDWLRKRGIDPLPFYDPPGEVADPALARRYPLTLVTPKTHLFLNSTFANQRRQHAAQPEPFVVIHPDDAAARDIADGAHVRVWNDRGAFEARARVSDDTRPDVLVAPMGWWNHDHAHGLSAQATTSQRLTVLGNAPTFNDNRVEATPLPPIPADKHGS
jgi:anaerobic selenocysteine-containing dehydrogenase